MIKKILPIAVLSMFVALLLPFSASAQGQSEEHRAEISNAVRSDKSQRPLRDEVDPPTPSVPRGGRDFEPGRPQAVGNTNPSTVDPLAQLSMGSSAAVTEPRVSTTGVGVDPNARVAPPDTTGDLGPNHYVQWVNSRYAIYTLTRDANKAITDFNAVPGFPKNGNAVFAGMNSRCATTNDGDPIVQYDQMADRWVLTQFVAGSSPYLQCVAVSTTPDPTGTYYRYEFSYGNDFNDYGKMGVWSDSYVMTFNMFRRARSFVGNRVCAYERSKMLLGQTARQICSQTSSSYGSLLPADIEGANLPAAGTALPLLSITSSTLLSWKFAVNWTAGTGTLTGPTTVTGVATFSRACGGGTCIPQPGVTQLIDSLADRLMYRLSYRKFADGHESLLVNHSVANAGTTAVRWYELRNAAGNTISAATPVVYQQGTHAPTPDYRWMGSAAMDKTGGIAIGYNISNKTNLNPSIRYAGRGPADPLGVLGAEGGLLTGPGVQTGNNLSRWGDYSTLNVDPVDGCTMVFTTEFIPSNGSFNWSTHIGSFKLSTCQ
jgi:hypothetical protein